MMKPRHIISLLLVLLPIQLLVSQDRDADLIFYDGTVLEGFGLIKKNGDIKFRLSLEDKADTWSHDMVKRIVLYGFEDQGTYEYIQLKEGRAPKLLKLLTEGQVILYSETVQYYSNDVSTNSQGGLSVSGNKFQNSTLYVKRKNEDYPTPLSGNFKRKTKAYFGDCPGLHDRVATMNLEDSRQ